MNRGVWFNCRNLRGFPQEEEEEEHCEGEKWQKKAEEIIFCGRKEV